MKKYIPYFLLLLFMLFAVSSCTVEHSVEPAYEITGYPWEFATPAALGMNDSLIYAGFTAALNMGSVYSVVIIKDGKIAATSYLHGSTSTDVYDVKSVTKSYTSAFTGIAIQKGIITLDTKLTDYFPVIKATAPDKRVNDITVRHLLTMTSGLKTDDEIFPTSNMNNWTEFILSYSLDNAPGTTYRYSDAGVYLLSALLTKATGQNTFDFAKTNFFDPLNFSLQGWFYSPDGIPVGGSSMMFTPKNMAVIGQLYLNKGKLNGQQIVSESWVDASLTDHIGWQDDEWGSMKKLGYGYLWWLGEINGHKVFSAIGYGGQFVLCVPDYNLVIAVCSNSNVDSITASSNSTKIINLAANYFIPAVK